MANKERMIRLQFQSFIAFLLKYGNEIIFDDEEIKEKTENLRKVLLEKKEKNRPGGKSCENCKFQDLPGWITLDENKQIFCSDEGLKNKYCYKHQPKKEKSVIK